MSPGITEVDETAASGGGVGALVDEAEMDAQTPVRQTDHPYGAFCKRMREELNLPNSQSTREVISAVVRAVSDLSVIDESQVKAQATHIGKLISDDRKLREDPQLWDGPATKIAEHVLKLRIEGKAPVSALAEVDAEAA